MRRPGTSCTRSPSCWQRRSPPASAARARFRRTIRSSLGSGGNAIPATVDHFLNKADLIFGIGCSFTKTNFGVDMPAGKAIIHATLEPMDVNKDVECELALVGDAKLTLQALLPAIEAELARPRAGTPSRSRRRSRRCASRGSPSGCRSSPRTSRRSTPTACSGTCAHGRRRQHDHHPRRRQPARPALAVLEVHDAALLHRLGQDHAARLRPRPRHGRQARTARQALHQRLGRCGDRLHRHGLRDRGARAHPDPLDPAQQLLHGDRAEGHAGLDRALPLDRHLRRLRGDGARVRRLWRAGRPSRTRSSRRSGAASSRPSRARRRCWSSSPARRSTSPSSSSGEPTHGLGAKRVRASSGVAHGRSDPLRARQLHAHLPDHRAGRLGDRAHAGAKAAHRLSRCR